MSAVDIIDHDHDRGYTEAVQRNISALLAIRGMKAKDLVARIEDATKLTEQKFSTRMHGTTRWLGVEIKAIAVQFGVSQDTITAGTEREFRERYTASAREPDTHLTLVPDNQPARRGSAEVQLPLPMHLTGL